MAPPPDPLPIAGRGRDTTQPAGGSQGYSPPPRYGEGVGGWGLLKYVNTGVVFSEIPDEVTLSINISRCPCHCPGCHSQYLWEDIGVPLTPGELDRLVGLYGSEITCVALMGGDAEPHTISALAAYLRHTYPRLKVAWYSGRSILPKAIDKPLFHYIKLGPFIQHLGPLNQPTTNQRLYKQMPEGTWEDITRRFWKK